ncbi:tripartite tricarboxylate transporter TctB family protein [Paracoccus luteus]|uniref:tripartite tricarboxylate transporter TctB family protein n=1 Tax=Paracoccus luteus TaxID=2508543 RepID=UPI00106F6BBE|nr:tripartite tricarboxylate transporter TctB family protein [Paracoccus luteus]
MRVGRLPAEMLAAALTGGLGLAGVLGSAELGASWTESGPEPGYFPFYVGLILIAAALGNGVMALRARGAQDEAWLEPEQSRRLLGFLVPLLAYVAGSVWLGLYVASAVYVAFNARFRGGYRGVVAVAIGAAFTVLLYVVFEMAFKVPLLKGPLEPLLGIH